MKKFAILMLTLLLLLSGCSRNNKGDNNLPKKVKIGIIRVPNDTSVAMAENYFDKFFKDKGIETEFIFFDSGVAANQAFSSGSIDFAEMWHTNGVVALANNLPVKLIWIHEILGSNEALVVKNDSGISKIEDLAGEKIATTFSSTSHLSLTKALEAAGILDQVQLLDMQTAEIVAAWERGDISAAYSWEPGLSRLKENGRVLVDSEQLAKEGILTANIDLVHNNFADKYPNLVSDYLKVLNMAVDLYKNNEDKAVSAAASVLEISEKEAKHQMAGTIWLSSNQQISDTYLGSEASPGNFHEVFYQTSIFLKDQGNIIRDLSIKEINKFIDSSYIENSLKN